MKLPYKIIAVLCVLFPINMLAQHKLNLRSFTQKMRPDSVIKSMNEHDVFNTIEIGANIGTTGLGLELASPMTKWTKLRVGFDWMPPFTVPMSFNMESYVGGTVNDKFETIQSLMKKLTGFDIDKEIFMDSKPSMTTIRVLVDVYPFKNNRHWHFTTGFFWGDNTIGKSLNKITEMSSLLALNVYNRFYRKIMSIDDFREYFIDNPLYGDNYLRPGVINQLEPDFEDLKENLKTIGELGVHVGDHRVINSETGEEELIPYMMKPDYDGTVSAKAKVNRFRPYVGFGYGGALTADGKWQASFDAGVQFWGGVPKVTTHDGTVLNDLVNLKDKVKSYMNLMKAIPVYPTIDFRLSYTF